jgi:hypothetical protein
MFDPERGGERRPLLFLHQFVKQLSKPARAQFEDIDYVPTQVMTEYLLRIFRKGEVDGILYPSALTGDVSAVLSVSNEPSKKGYARKTLP